MTTTTALMTVRGTVRDKGRDKEQGEHALRMKETALCTPSAWLLKLFELAAPDEKSCEKWSPTGKRVNEVQFAMLKWRTLGKEALLVQDGYSCRKSAAAECKKSAGARRQRHHRATQASSEQRTVKEQKNGDEQVE